MELLGSIICKVAIFRLSDDFDCSDIFQIAALFKHFSACTYSLMPPPFLNNLLAPNAVLGVRMIPCIPRVVPGDFNIKSEVLNKAIHDSLGRIDSTSQPIMESCEEAVLSAPEDSLVERNVGTLAWKMNWS